MGKLRAQATPGLFKLMAKEDRDVEMVDHVSQSTKKCFQEPVARIDSHTWRRIAALCQGGSMVECGLVWTVTRSSESACRGW